MKNTMMALETRINGMLIGMAYIRNTGSLSGEKTVYDVRYLRPEGEPSVIEFQVVHVREKGAESLALAVYQGINKILNQGKIKK